MENQEKELLQPDPEQLAQLSVEQLRQAIDILNTQLEKKQAEEQAPKPAAIVAQFEEEGQQYGILIPKFRLGKTIYTAQEVADNAELRKELLKLASEGADGPRSEEDFHENGILKLIY